MKNNELYTDKITKGSRTYFFDIKESENGGLFLKISESKKVKDNFEHYRVLIFEEDLNDFVETLNKTLTKFKEFKEPKEIKAYSVDTIRETYKQAYFPWTIDDDNKLELLFCEGKRVKELAQIFERNIGAINSRIKKLELKEKYGK